MDDTEFASVSTPKNRLWGAITLSFRQTSFVCVVFIQLEIKWECFSCACPMTLPMDMLVCRLVGVSTVLVKAEKYLSNY